MRGSRRFQNCSQDTFEVGQHFIFPEAQDPEAVLLQELRSRVICRGLLGMLSAIDFNDQSIFNADKIDDVWSDRVLAAKLEAV
jgi:hypothetical protein